MSKWNDIIEAVRILGAGDLHPEAEHDVIYVAWTPISEIPPWNIKREPADPADDEERETVLIGTDGRELGVHWAADVEAWTCYV